MRTIKARVEFEIPIIRHMSIECPDCHEWFIAEDISNNHIRDRFDANYSMYTCPLCGSEFGYLKDKSPFQDCDEIEFEECSTGLIYDKVKRKTERLE